MAVNFTIPLLSVRASTGLSLLCSKKTDYSELDKFNNFNDDSKNCRVSCFHNSGNLFAYCNSNQVKIYKLDTFENVANIDKPRTSSLSFSPTGTYIVLWEPFFINKSNPNEVDNLNIYNVNTGQLVKSVSQKKQLEIYIHWSNDEKIFATLANGEIRFFETQNFDVYVQHIAIENLTSFSMSGISNHIAVHLAGKKSQPSSVRLFKYPNTREPVSNKSFFNADRIEFKWNKSGTGLLLLCSTETSADSYYGDTTLHYMNINGESLVVTLSKKGAIYSLEWSPVKDEFVVVYGAMPAKATLFNNKCEAIFDFGTAPRNECFYSPIGNIICLCGFGNLRGRIEVWNLNTSNKVPEQLCSIAADDTTYFEWCPDGEHLLTATTAPRLRVSNGYKIWNYIGETKFTYKMPPNTELWQVQWQPGSFIKNKSINIKKPVAVQEEIKAYVPPHLRGKSQVSSIVTKLHEDDEKPDTKLKIKQSKSDDPAVELEKKIKLVKKKIQQINDLKKKQESGTKLEKNQLDKINSEDALIEELEKLELGKK